MTDAALPPAFGGMDDAGTVAVPRAWRGKRAFDVGLSLLLLVLCLPLLVFIALAVTVTSPGPAFFRQQRVGFGGREFPILKFRTMRVDSEELLASDPTLRELYLAGDHKIPGPLDPRVTRLGRLLRMSSLDELPQLLNVLRGDMSLVGPRPVSAEQLPEYGDLVSIYVGARPGLSGLWQVSGRSSISFPKRAEIDAEYYERCSLRTDMGILARTVGAVLAGRGAS